MFVGTVLAVWLAGRFFDRRRFTDFGLSLSKREWWMDFAFGVMLSTAPILIVLLTLQGMGWIVIEGVFKSKLAGWPIVLALIGAVAIYICVGAFEEIARVYQMRNLLEAVWVRFGRWGAACMAIGVAALISVLMHLADLEFFPPRFPCICSVGWSFPGIVLSGNRTGGDCHCYALYGGFFDVDHLCPQHLRLF